ncbi:MAG: hypothetical protein AB4426_13015 [Xenococcaceae cyanobacterium]
MTATKTRLWTVKEYHRMIETGILTHIPHPAIPESTIARLHVDQIFQ